MLLADEIKSNDNLKSFWNIEICYVLWT